MTEITAAENVTLDGVMQAPGRHDEDPRGGFAHGGWAAPYADEVAMARASARMGGEGAMLLGRRTFELLRRSLSGREDNPFSAHLDAARSTSSPARWAIRPRGPTRSGWAATPPIPSPPSSATTPRPG